MKHALLVWLLRALARKEAPFRVLDTHAGIGRYDLASDEAQRTGEWQGGIGRLSGITEGPLADYLDLVRADGGYPGSPALAAAVLRPQDRLALVELHEADHATLRALFRRDARVAVHKRDAFEAVRALTPFPEKRGLVLMDPPFEQPGEYERLTAAMTEMSRRARGLVQAAVSHQGTRAGPRLPHGAGRIGRAGRGGGGAASARAAGCRAAQWLRPGRGQSALWLRGGGLRHAGGAARGPGHGGGRWMDMDADRR